MGEEIVDRSYRVKPRSIYYVQPALVYVPPSPSFGLCCSWKPDLRFFGPGIDEKLQEVVRQFTDGIARKVA